jgi:hypothetical protein
MNRSFYQLLLMPFLDMFPLVLGGVVLDYLEFPALDAVVAFLLNLNVQRLKLLGEVNDYANVVSELMGAVKWYLPSTFDFKSLDVDTNGEPVAAHFALNLTPSLPPTISPEERILHLMNFTKTMPTFNLHGGLLQRFAALIENHIKPAVRLRELPDQPPEPPSKRSKTSHTFRRISAGPPRMSARH